MNTQSHPNPVPMNTSLIRPLLFFLAVCSGFSITLAEESSTPIIQVIPEIASVAKWNDSMGAGSGGCPGVA